jgi:hypothetical protein
MCPPHPRISLFLCACRHRTGAVDQAQLRQPHTQCHDLRPEAAHNEHTSRVRFSRGHLLLQVLPTCARTNTHTHTHTHTQRHTHTHTARACFLKSYQEVHTLLCPPTSVPSQHDSPSDLFAHHQPMESTGVRTHHRCVWSGRRTVPWSRHWWRWCTVRKHDACEDGRHGERVSFSSIYTIRCRTFVTLRWAAWPWW